MREKAGLEVIDLGAPMDALWLRLSRRPGDPEQTFGRIDAGRILAMIDRGNYWQCAYVIPKGAADEIRRKGLPSLRDEIATLIPFARDRVGELGDWSEIKLLTVRVDRLRRWYRPGLLCIGDAAHAMSPIGGVGINLAVQDAVAAANILGLPAPARGCRHRSPSRSAAAAGAADPFYATLAGLPARSCGPPRAEHSAAALAATSYAGIWVTL